MNKNGVEAVIFDLGRVLVDVNFGKGIMGYFSGGASDPLRAVHQIYSEPLFRDYNCGRISSAEFYEEINFKYSLELKYHDFVDKWCNVFEVIPGMPDLVERVARKYKVGLLSDTDPLHWHYCLNRFPFLKIFKRPALSYEVGQLKPAGKCYLIAAENIKTKPERCLFIDDRPENVLGARKAGMRAIRFFSPKKLTADLQSHINL